MVDFSHLQTQIGRWALSAFGPTAADFHAARMTREMADVLDCIAKGDSSLLGRALAGVFVVGFALAESQEIDLLEALKAEHEENIRSQWVRDDWGQWVRRGDGSVPDSAPAAIIGMSAAQGKIAPQYAVAALCSLGAGQSQAIEYLVRLGLSAADFHAPTPIDAGESDGEAMVRLEAEKQDRIHALQPPELRLFPKSYIGGVVSAPLGGQAALGRKGPKFKAPAAPPPIAEIGGL